VWWAWTIEAWIARCVSTNYLRICRELDRPRLPRGPPLKQDRSEDVDGDEAGVAWGLSQKAVAESISKEREVVKWRKWVLGAADGSRVPVLRRTRAASGGRNIW
jgi:hypothetical protein